MADDWIKMRCDLAADPAVIAVAARLGLNESHVVGLCHRLWSWASRHTTTGKARGVTVLWLDRFIGFNGFASALAEVGWLKVTDRGITISKFDRHNSQSAKTRALTAIRLARKRERDAKRDCNDGVVTQSLPEKEKELSTKRDKAPRACARDPEPTPQPGNGAHGASPATEAEAVALCQLAGVPDQAAAQAWNELEGAGWVDRSGRAVPRDRFVEHVKGVWLAREDIAARIDRRAAGARPRATAAPAQPARETLVEFKPAKIL